MKLKYIFVFLLLLVPVFLFGQTPVNETDFQKAVDWLQGGSVLEDWFMKAFLKDYKQVVMSKWDSYTGIARAIGAVATLLYFGQKAFEMMTGGKIEIMPLMRPFALLMVIAFWTQFIGIVSAPMDAIASQASNQYHQSVTGINQLRAKRNLMQMQVIDAMFEFSADNEIAAEAGKKSFLDGIVDAVSGAVNSAIENVMKPIMKFKLKMQVGIQLIMTQLLELLALWILRICVYGIFLIQIIYSGVLIMLGPLAVAFSIFPMFKDSFGHWLARFISVQFYVIVAFVILTITSTIQEFAFKAEIGRYSEIISDSGALVNAEKMLFLSANGIISFGMVIISFLISGVAILTTPTVSTWIITTTGLGGAINTLTRSGKAVASGGTSLITK